MTTIIENIEITEGETTISKIIWRKFKRPMPGLIERVVELNYDLVEDGYYLAVGSILKLPVDTDPEPVSAAPVRLWN